jgi:hypothetical protein
VRRDRLPELGAVEHGQVRAVAGRRDQVRGVPRRVTAAGRRAALESAADRALRPGGFIDGDVDLLLGESEGSLSTSISGNSRRE